MEFIQQPHTLLMVRPAAFGFNEQTASSNSFQQRGEEGQAKALAEFDRMVDALRSHDIDVRVFEDTATPQKPDAVFPNNWISFHQDGRVILYPMMAENRRTERRADIVDVLRDEFVINEVVDLSAHEENGWYLEGTGSLVFDHVNRITYASRSPRTSDLLVEKACDALNYKPVIFDAVDENNSPIYHTNVILSVGRRFAVVCLDAIRSEEDQETLLKSFSDTEHKVVAISYAQMKAFAGNILEVISTQAEPVVAMSETAYHALLPGQINAISQFADILPVAVPYIETTGGGSVRCMISGIHLPRR